MQPIDKSLALLGCTKTATLTEIKAGYKKKVLAYSSSATGAGKLEEISAAYVEVSPATQWASRTTQIICQVSIKSNTN